jgi:hypothetical protein
MRRSSSESSETGEAEEEEEEEEEAGASMAERGRFFVTGALVLRTGAARNGSRVAGTGLFNTSLLSMMSVTMCSTVVRLL